MARPSTRHPPAYVVDVRDDLPAPLKGTIR